MLALHNDDRQKHMCTHLTCVAVIKVCENKHVVNREFELITEHAKETTDTSHVSRGAGSSHRCVNQNNHVVFYGLAANLASFSH